MGQKIQGGTGPGTALSSVTPSASFLTTFWLLFLCKFDRMLLMADIKHTHGFRLSKMKFQQLVF
jgi:hypothetical protein